MTARIERTIPVAASPGRAWQAWTGEINRWWTKPYYNDAALVKGLVMEPHLGGRFMELWDEEGSGFLIGQVLEWLPPGRLAYTWTEKSWAGVSTVISIAFAPEGDGTRMTVVHEGFDRLPDGARQRDGYDAGWEDLLGKFKLYLETA